MNKRPEDICGLCCQVRTLCSSHLLPRACYRLLRDDTKPNPNPHLLDRSALEKHVPSQVKDYLLCKNCEQRLRRYGEDWAMKHCHRGRGSFRLGSILASSTPFLKTDHIFAYEGSQIEGIEHLAYFAASVIWRAAARSWHLRRRVFIATKLGSYGEAFRLYLLGLAPFPEDAALVVIVSRREDPILAVQFPEAMRQERVHHHWFHIPGIALHMWVGKEIPVSLRRLCLAHSPSHVICSSDRLDDDALRMMAAQWLE
jgi:hypothetical protein